MGLYSEESDRTVAVSKLLFEAVAASMRAAELTDGYVDPTVGSSLSSLGYSKDFELLQSESPAGRSFRVSVPVGHRRIRLNRATSEVSVPMGTVIDLGATAKAFMADRICAELESEFSIDCLINLGGDISCSLVGEDDPWLIKLTEDDSLDPSAPGMTFGVLGGGVATSSIASRRWFAGGEVHHHIVDPYSGRSADVNYLSVTVLAGSALDANIASCGTIAMGGRGLDWLRSTELPAVIKYAGNGAGYTLADQGGVNLEFIGRWPAELAATVVN